MRKNKARYNKEIGLMLIQKTKELTLLRNELLEDSLSFYGKSNPLLSKAKRLRLSMDAMYEFSKTFRV